MGNKGHATDYKSIGIKPWVNIIIRVAWATVLTIYNRLQVSGREHIPNGAVIIAPNHNSHLDPPVVAAAAYRRTIAYLGKDRLFRVPIFNTFIWRLGCIPVHQNGPDHLAVKLSVEMLHRGFALGLFPEGHRSSDGELHPLLKGVALISKLSGAPVVPTAIWGTHRALPPGSFFYLPAKIRIVFGQPVSFEKFANEFVGKGDLLEAFTRLIESNILHLLRELQGNPMQQDATATPERQL